MTRDQNAVEKITKLTTDQVAEYLRVNPEFFENHPDTIADLKIPHLAGEGTISLIEKQIHVLREQNRVLNEQLRTFALLASQNDELWQKFKDLAVFLIRRGSVGHLQEKLENWLKKQYRLSGVVIHTNSKKQMRQVLPEDKTVQKLLDEMKIQCGSEFSQPLLEPLFKSGAENVKSSALIPLRQGKSRYRGLLVLGSDSPERFSGQQSTSYLECLSQLVSQALFPA